jgi:hypothetical protein
MSDADRARHNDCRAPDALEDELAYPPWLSETGLRTIRDEAHRLRARIANSPNL